MGTAILLFPDFALILLGLGIRRWMHLGDHFWAGLEKLVYFILFPALLLNAMIKSRLEFSAATPLVATGLACLGAGMAAAYLARYFFGLRPLVFASIYQCGFRFNSYIGLAAAGLLYGQEGIAAMGLLIGAAVPLANLASVWMLARHGNLQLWREIARNPLIWATVTGLLLNLGGFSPPKVMQIFLSRLAVASIALGLLAVGAALKVQGGAAAPGARVYLIAVKLLLLPMVALFLGPVLGLQGTYFAIAVLFAALPTASSAYILAMRMGGDGQSVAWLISAGTLASGITLPLWAAWLAR